MEQAGGRRVICAGIFGGFAWGWGGGAPGRIVAVEESRPETEAQEAGRGRVGGAEGIAPRNMASVAPNPGAPGPSSLDTYPAAARTACQLATGRALQSCTQRPRAVAASDSVKPSPVRPRPCARGLKRAACVVRASYSLEPSPAQPLAGTESFVASFRPVFVNKRGRFLLG